MQSVGSRLRDARETRGLSLEDIAQITKISRSHLDAIENDNFQVLPAPAFARGFVRSYASAVGLDPNEMVRALPSSLDVVESSSSRRRRDNLAYMAANRRRAEGLVSKSSQILLVLVAISMFLAAWWMVGANKGGNDNGQATKPGIERRAPNSGISDASSPSPGR